MVSLTVTVGTPASGKTHWTMSQINSRVWRVNRDQLRIMSHGKWIGVPEAEGQVTLAQDLLVKGYLRAGADVIADDTNMGGPRDIQRWISIATETGASLRVIDFLDVPIETCVIRNRNRSESEKVPSSVIYKMWCKLHDAMFPGWRDEDPHEDREVVEKFRAYVRSCEEISELVIMI